jgi:hypothetical protein
MCGKSIEGRKPHMKRAISCFTVLIFVSFFGRSSAFAQRGHGHEGGPPAAQTGAGQNSRAQGNGGGGMGHEADVSQRLEQNHRLSSGLESLLPPGANLQEASRGFKNLGQFIAAVHASHNLGIPFDEMKAKLTGPDAMSLGKAIHELKPDMDPKAADAEAKRAEKQAKETIKDSGK